MILSQSNLLVSSIELSLFEEPAETQQSFLLADLCSLSNLFDCQSLLSCSQSLINITSLETCILCINSNNCLLSISSLLYGCLLGLSLLSCGLLFVFFSAIVL